MCICIFAAIAFGDDTVNLYFSGCVSVFARIVFGNDTASLPALAFDCHAAA